METKNSRFEISYIDKDDYFCPKLLVVDSESNVKMEVIAQFYDTANGEFLGFDNDVFADHGGFKSSDDSAVLWYQDSKGSEFLEKTGLSYDEVETVLEKWLTNFEEEN